MGSIRTIIIRHGRGRGNAAMRGLLRQLGCRAKQRQTRTARADERLADGYARIVERHEARHQAGVASN
jgi:hypothetical protein